MRIAVIGAGAMGSIYGGHLSLHNDVYLVDTNQAVVDAVNANGLTLEENGQDKGQRLPSDSCDKHCGSGTGRSHHPVRKSFVL